MNIMTIDPGKRKNGIFIFCSNGIKRPYFIDNRKAKTEKEIFNNVTEKIEKLIDIFQIQIVVIESYAFAQRKTAQLMVAEIKGIIKNIAYRFERYIKIIMMPIQTWKKYMPKNIYAIRQKKKRWISEYKKVSSEHSGFDFKTEDIADAYWMAYAINAIMNGIIYTDADKKIKEQLL